MCLVAEIELDQDEPKFTCRACGRAYKHAATLSRHLRLECGREPQFPCPLCVYKAKRKGTLQSHMLFKHKISQLSVPISQ